MTVDDWDYREVCPDGGCIGVIGADGTCKVCGRVSPTWDNERERGMVVEGADPALDPVGDDEDEGYEDDEDGDGEDGDGEAGDEGDGDAASASDEPDWVNRKLCPDGACVGVIRDGVCTVCGKTAA